MGEMTAVVKQIAQIVFQGDIIPPQWFQCPILKTSKGKTYLLAINLLANFVYWYRPRAVRDEASGALIRYEKKFEADKLRVDYKKLAVRFGVTKRQVQDACAFLRKAELITIELRTVIFAGTAINNVVFIEPCPDRVREATEFKGQTTAAAAAAQKPGWVYLIAMPDGQLHRLGKTTDIEKCRRDYAKRGTKGAQFVHSFETSNAHESIIRLRAIWADKRTGKELYELAPGDVEWFMRLDGTLSRAPVTGLPIAHVTGSHVHMGEPVTCTGDTYIETTEAETSKPKRSRARRAVSNKDNSSKNARTRARAKKPMPPEIAAAHRTGLEWAEGLLGTFSNRSAQAGAMRWILEHGNDLQTAQACFEQCLAELARPGASPSNKQWRTTFAGWLTVQKEINVFKFRRAGAAAARRNGHVPSLQERISAALNGVYVSADGDSPRNLKVLAIYELLTDRGVPAAARALEESEFITVPAIKTLVDEQRELWRQSFEQ